MPDSTETGEAFDTYGRRLAIGRDRYGAVYIDSSRDRWLYEGRELEKLREAIDRAAMPGQPEPPRDERMAVDEHGTLKPVSEFAADERWWCDGEDCDGPGGPDLTVPHVHPMYGPARPVDLITGREVSAGHAAAGAQAANGTEAEV